MLKFIYTHYFTGTVESTDSLDVFKAPMTAGIVNQKTVENYELATHTVKIRRTGHLADVKAIWDLTGRL